MPKETKPIVPEKSADQLFWENAAKKGYEQFYIMARSEDLENPNKDYITIGWKDANGLTLPAMTSTKEAWLTLAKLLIAKYEKA